jgi:hypothetical protein
MVPSENAMSVDGRRALQDMVELQMYLVAQSRQAPWSLLPRRSKGPHEFRAPFSNPVESSVGKELADLGFIEATSTRTFVVSKSGLQFYERELNLRSA